MAANHNSLAVKAAPAVLSAGAYLNAKWKISHDLNFIKNFGSSEILLARTVRQGRMNLFYKLEEQAMSKTTANSTFILYEGESYTFKQTYDLVLQYGTFLKQRYGLQKEDKVAMDMMNCPQFIFLWYGLWSIGVKPAFINYNLTGDALIHSIKTCKARALIVDPEVFKAQFTPELVQRLKNLDAGAVDPLVFTPEVEAVIHSTRPVRDPDAQRSGQEAHHLALLIFTSGTTGMPKAAVVSWRKLFTGGNFMRGWLPLTTSDRFYTCMPLYHSSASILCVMPCLTKGSAVAIGRKFSTKTFWPEVRNHKATIIQYVGETCRYLLAAPPQIDPVTGENLDQKHQVKIAFGNGLRPDVWDRFKARFAITTIAEFYGMTEGPVALWNRSSNSLSSGAIGDSGLLLNMLLGGMLQVIEIDWATENAKRYPSSSSSLFSSSSSQPANGYCRKVARGTPGELIMYVDADAMEQRFQGYFDNTSATQSKILRDVFRKGDAYFRSGDVVRQDKEGRFFFVDRLGDTFRWKSENVSTAEVAAAVGEHPAIAEANVYGVTVPRHDGRAGCAAIVLHDASQSASQDSLMAELPGYLADRLPKYAVPLFLRIVTTMERTGTNKQTKVRLRAEGADPGKLAAGETSWCLREGRYVKMDQGLWRGLERGDVRL